MSEDGWHYLDEKEGSRGPFDANQMERMRCRGVLDSDTMVWKVGWSDWKALATTELMGFQSESSRMEDERDGFLDDDGTLYVWNEEIGAFLPEGEELLPRPGAEQSSVEKKKDRLDERGNKKDTKQGKNKSTTSVYITGLPLDAKVEEVLDVFTKFGGIIRKDPISDTHKIKLYTHPDTGKAKGDGLVTYLVRESVDQACNLLDGVSLRVGDTNVMSVRPAQFKNSSDQSSCSVSQRSKRIKRQKPMQAKELGWDGFDDTCKPEETTVVLKHMFDPDSIAEEPELLAELEDDVGEECVKFGRLENLRIYKQHAQGVITIRFKRREGAEQCVKTMNGRFYDGRQIEAHMWDGKTNYLEESRENEEEQQRRLEQFARDLEDQG